jgi:ABC-2 type transport system ATP-binding protein
VPIPAALLTVLAGFDTTGSAAAAAPPTPPAYDVPPDRYRANLARFSELLASVNSWMSRYGSCRWDSGCAATSPQCSTQPRIFYLDEPTPGWDVVAKERIRTFVADLNAGSGTTLVLTTHDLDDVERLCRRIVLIDHGRAVYDGDVARLKAGYAPDRDLVVQVPGDGGRS